MNYKCTEQQKKMFCCYYVKLGNIYEASLKSGFPQEEALSIGVDLLNSKTCQKTIARLNNVCQIDLNRIITGLERLAFGTANDAVLLAMSDDFSNPNFISTLDLFNVAEIKKPKGGGVEIKLFDRLKAFEKMFEFINSASSVNTADSLISALVETNDEEGDI